MSAAEQAVVPSPLRTTTLGAAFRRTVEEHADRVAVRTADGATEWTWRTLAASVDAFAAGLHGLGVRPGDRVAILMGNRPEFHLVDLAISTVGATPFSVYLTSAPSQIAYVVDDAEARVMITDQTGAERVEQARTDIATLETLIVIDGPAAEGRLSLDDVVGAADGTFDAASAVQEQRADDVATIIYTSGTTGEPKGVELTHRNVMAALADVHAVLDLPSDARVVSWLPNAHIAERVVHHYVPIAFGAQVTCCADPRMVIEVLPSVRPSWFFAVPRVWEKLKAALEARFAAMGEKQRAAVDAALAAGLEKVRLEQAGEAIPDELAVRVADADAVFAPIRQQLGLDQAIAVQAGAAPTPRPVLEFFNAIGVPLAEVWGMSETCGGAACNPPGRARLGTVGPANPSAEIRIADDGEVLVRGPIVMRGYRGKDEATAAAIDADGWLHTGDIGRLDGDGYLTIIDRKKEIIINAAGKNMSPAMIEATVKSASPLIGQAVCIGDACPYNTALVVLDPDAAALWAERHGRAGRSVTELAADPDVLAEIDAAITRANQRLSRVEQIKRHTVLAEDWLPGSAQLTPTMKLRRKPIAEMYEARIAAMYR